MRFSEINLFGVYVAPISIMMMEFLTASSWYCRSGRWPLGLAALRLASRPVCVCGVRGFVAFRPRS